MAQVFTDAQIQEILSLMKQHFSVEQYIGARYVPIFGRKDEDSIIWDNSEPYEPLTIVLYQGNSYTSRQYVPTGIDILNEEFWANTGNYNAQVEQYRQEVLAFNSRIDALEDKFPVSYNDLEKPNFVLFGDSWTDFGAGFENWFQLGGLANSLNCNLINFGHGGAGFTIANNSIQSQLTTALNTMSEEEINNTKYVVVVGLVNDVSNNTTNYGLPSTYTISTYAILIRDHMQALCNSFPNAKIIWAPDTCNRQLDANKFSNCVSIVNIITTRDLQYSTKAFIVAPNLPFFWIGHSGAEVMRNDNLHLNKNGAYAFARCILAACEGQSFAPYTAHLNVTDRIMLHANNMGMLTLNGYLLKESAAQHTIELSNTILDIFTAFKQLNYGNGYVWNGVNGNLTATCFLAYLGGDTMNCKSNQGEVTNVEYYF